MQKIARYISFSSGVVRTMHYNTVEQQIDEAIARCANVNQNANLLDEKYNIIATVKYYPEVKDYGVNYIM